ncbi:MAG: polymerase LigD, polymerase domain protein [Firmicutes bacterium]|nr:polymerase LigD, polymerase domain protein [Bacillota bacterium]
MPDKTVLDVEGTQLKLSNLEKIFYPKCGFNKRQMIDYYIRIAPFLLPHMEGRPLTLKRYPHGVDEKFFYQKECPAKRPGWLPTAPVWSEGNNKYINFCLVEDLPSLVWAANLAALELHTSLSQVKDIYVPTMLVFDLDPGWPATIVDCAEVALWLQDFFITKNLQSYPKTSGSKGLQVYVPLNTLVNYSQTKDFAHNLAQLLEKKYPGQVVSNMRKSLRQGKVFIDWSQNNRHKTTVCVYSLRACEKPTVSTPVTWSEVELALRTKDISTLVFDTDAVLERVNLLGDLFAPVLTAKQYLP